MDVDTLPRGVVGVVCHMIEAVSSALQSKQTTYKTLTGREVGVLVVHRAVGEYTPSLPPSLPPSPPPSFSPSLSLSLPPSPPPSLPPAGSHSAGYASGSHLPPPASLLDPPSHPEPSLSHVLSPSSQPSHLPPGNVHGPRSASPTAAGQQTDRSTPHYQLSAVSPTLSTSTRTVLYYIQEDRAATASGVSCVEGGEQWWDEGSSRSPSPQV